MRKTIGAILTAATLALPATALGVQPSHGSGTAKPASPFVHHRTFTLTDARHHARRYEHGLPVKITACHWKNRWEAACSVTFHGVIFNQSSSPAVYTWTDLVAKFSPNLRFLTGTFSVQSVNLRQIGVVTIN